MKDFKNFIKFRHVLSKYRVYTPNSDTIDFKYSFDPQLEELKQKYALDDVIKNKDNVSQILALMLWVYDHIHHDGHCGPVEELNANFLLEYCRGKRNGINCLMVAIILQEVYMACGFYARIVQTKSIEASDLNSHWITIVYAESQKKWMMMDGTFCAYCYADNGILSIEEIRDYVINNKYFDVYEGVSQAGFSRNQYYFMIAQNFFQFDTLLINGFDSITKEGQEIITLVPTGFDFKEYHDHTMRLLNSLFKHQYENVMKAKGIIVVQDGTNDLASHYISIITQIKDNVLQNFTTELKRLQLHISYYRNSNDIREFWKLPL